MSPLVLVNNIGGCMQEAYGRMVFEPAYLTIRKAATNHPFKERVAKLTIIQRELVTKT
jgi:hypothetical protein